MERTVLRAFLYIALAYSGLFVVFGILTRQPDGDLVVPSAFLVGIAAALAISARSEPEASGAKSATLPKPKPATSPPPAAVEGRPAKVVERRPN